MYSANGMASAAWFDFKNNSAKVSLKLTLSAIYDSFVNKSSIA